MANAYSLGKNVLLFLLATLMTVSVSACNRDVNPPTVLPAKSDTPPTEFSEVIVVDAGLSGRDGRSVVKPTLIQDEAHAADLFAGWSGSDDLVSAYNRLSNLPESDEVWVQFVSEGCFLPDRVAAELNEVGDVTFKVMKNKQEKTVNCFRSVPAFAFVGVSD